MDIVMNTWLAGTAGERRSPKICAVVTRNDPEMVRRANLADLMEIRIDMIGEGWRRLVRGGTVPWIACNRSVEQGGRWTGTEGERVESTLKAIDLGASIVDIESNAPDSADLVDKARRRGAQCLLSYHDLQGTPDRRVLKNIVRRQIEAGADIWKVVTTAARFEDNITMLALLGEFDAPGVSFAMGEVGVPSRMLSPLAGAVLTYASLGEGLESAPGQITLEEMRKIYSLVV